MRLADAPNGYADGYVRGYRTCDGRLEVVFEFWNAQVGTLVFERFVGLRDLGAVGVEVGGVVEVRKSEFLSELVARDYVEPPVEIPWQQTSFLDVDDNPMLEVVFETFRIEFQAQ